MGEIERLIDNNTGDAIGSKLARPNP